MNLRHEGRALRSATVVVAVALVAHASAALAQRAQVALQKGPYYVGEAILIRVTSEGFANEPQPTCEIGPLPADLTLTLVAVNPSRSSVVRNINGRITQYTRVVYTFDFHAVSQKPNSYVVSPITVKQNEHSATTGAISLDIQAVQIDPKMRVALILPAHPVYPGQHVPITIEWWYAGDVKEVRNLMIRSSLFDRFVFLDEPISRDDSPLPIDTEKGTVRLKASVTKRVLDGREFLVWSAKRRVVVDKPAEHELAPISATIEKVTRWRRNFFGDRTPVVTTRLRAVGKPQKLVVRSLPLTEAPVSFAGAVGRGFSIEVTADRSVVRAGDPITLTITVQGDGNLRSAGLPPLFASPNDLSGRLDAKHFRVPGGEVAGTLLNNGKSKRFSVTIRVLDDAVSGIPPLAYSWFDSQQSTFKTTHSNPIALRVLPAQMVGAQDVVGGTADPEVTDQAKQAAPRSLSALDAGDTRQRLDLIGADLAIEPDAAQLLMDESQRFGGHLMHGLIYAGSVALLAVVWLWRRATDVDPEQVRRRRLITHQIRVISHAAKLPRHQGADRIAVALRHIVPLSKGVQRSQIDEVLAECDVLAYAPNADPSQPLDTSLYERAVCLARSVATEVTCRPHRPIRQE